MSMPNWLFFPALYAGKFDHPVQIMFSYLSFSQKFQKPFRSRADSIFFGLAAQTIAN
jgi:hypothetical protein